MALIQVIYVSSATGELDEAELEKMLESSVRHNQAQGVTGMLLYAGGNFIQVLEGEEAAVDETMSRIEQDARHFQIMVLDRSPIEEREFGQWHMGFRRLSNAEVAGPNFVPFLKSRMHPESLSAKPGAALDLLRNFVELS
jgi:hypothetical protein